MLSFVDSFFSPLALTFFSASLLLCHFALSLIASPHQVPFFAGFPTSKGEEGCPLLLPPDPDRSPLRLRPCFAPAPPAPNWAYRSRALRSRLLFFDASPALCPRGRCSPCVHLRSVFVLLTSASLLKRYLDGLRAYWHKDHITYGGGRLLGKKILERGVPAPIREWIAGAAPATPLPAGLSYYAFVDGGPDL